MALSAMTQARILIGTQGWRHAAWENSFYPDDLPQEWQLAYYGNEFDVTLIPADYWQQGLSAVEAWLDETDTSPQFVCERPAQAAHIEVFEAGLALMAERLLGIVIPIDEMPAANALDIVRHYISDYKVCVEARCDEAVFAKIWEQLIAEFPQLGYCDNQLGAQPRLTQGELSVVRLLEAQLSARELRAQVEKCLAVSSAQHNVCLIVAGLTPSLESARNAAIILDLL